MSEGSVTSELPPNAPAQPLHALPGNALPEIDRSQIVGELIEVATNANKWSRANTIATLEMAVFALLVSMLAKGTTLTAEQIQSVISDASGLVGTAVAPAAAVKGLVEFLRSDR